MQPKDIFEELISNLKPFFKSNNYLKKGNSFYYLKDNNYGLITFQKSQKSNNNQIIFTINIGIYSKVVSNFLNSNHTKLKPTIPDCHWVRRIGDFFEPIHDKWWLINVNTSVSDLTKEICNAIREIFSLIDRYISDESLQLLWLSEESPGITKLDRLMNLSVLLKHSGNIEQLKVVLDQLSEFSEGSTFAYVAKQHIHEILR